MLLYLGSYLDVLAPTGSNPCSVLTTVTGGGAFLTAIPCESQSTRSIVVGSQSFLILICSSNGGPLLAFVKGRLSFPVTVPDFKCTCAPACGSNVTLVSSKPGVPCGSVMRRYRSANLSASQFS